MDPITLLAVIQGSVNLVDNCLKAVKGLHSLALKYRHAQLAMLSMIQELDIILLAWEQITERLQDCGDDDVIDSEVLRRIQRSLDCGVLVMSALEQDLAYYSNAALSLNSAQRLKSIWNNGTLQGHLDRIRGQAQSMSLLLTVVKLPEAPNRKRLLDQGAALLRRSDDSAFSVVPSRISSLTQDRFSCISSEDTELAYRELDVDDDLFTSRVYKRNYRNPRMIYQKKEQKPIDQAVGRQISTLDDQDRRRRSNFLTSKQQRQALTMTALERRGIIDTVSTRNSYPRLTPIGDLARYSNRSSQHRLSISSSTGESCALLEDVVRACGDYNSISEALWLIYPIQYPYVLGPTPDSKSFSVEGPAVSVDLRAQTWDHLNIRQSVSCTKPEDLKTLLVHIGSRFADWRKYFFLEACLQKRTPLVHLLLGFEEKGRFAGHRLATEGGYAEFIKVFLTWGIRHDTNMIEQHWLLHSAVEFNREDVVDFLIKEGAQVNHPDKNGIEPLHLACVRGNVYCVQSIIAAGAPANWVDSNGLQPIHYLGVREACDPRNVAEILDLLLLAGGSIETKTLKGQTLLQLACQNRKGNAFKAALLFGASQDSSVANLTALRLQCQNGNSSVVMGMLPYHRAADVCDTGTVGESPLSLAIKYGQGTVVQKLIYKAFDLEIRGATTLEPIYQACKKHNLPIIERLENYDDPFIISNLLAHGPLFPLGKSCIYWQSPTESPQNNGFAHDF
ncbi:MAG: hypothetical protein Q9195_008451 [Heterodermia aff. obscurata]